MKLPRRISEPGPLLEYINQLLRGGQPEHVKLAREIQRAVKTCLASKEGVILLDLLDKAILERTVPTTYDPRALDALNAQSFIALDLRRIASNETDAALEAHSTDTGTRRRGHPRG
ncbi:hypothetical protein MACH17_18570 [Phaeobacter inhibens]|uniref:hypothetical protein n=1 Tax=Phaeobacter inhibens TaxID=221822 RepID=UPI00276DBEDD|nr:hypothetical protein [Phaeobacter inhibens]GLO70340.1 hypothetical protein MACH17_18570 [Phaeobacter inhibens]